MSTSVKVTQRAVAAGIEPDPEGYARLDADGAHQPKVIFR
jgi:hypothetical protein